jgi:UDP-N-acetyl-D-glucosamine dehydrogenase
VNTIESIVSRIRSNQITVAIIGLGYVGLPLVREFAAVGFTVLGLDIDGSKVDKLNRGESYISYVFSDSIASLLEKGKFQATSDFSKLALADAILVCVPTPLNDYRNPDLSFVIETTKTISEYLKQGQLIILQSTTYPGTTEEEVLPILASGGLIVGKDFFLAYSPERISPGNVEFATSQIPRVVSGVTPNCLLLTTALYERIVSKTIAVRSPKVAEATKLLENIYRSVNIALVNELKVIFERMGIDIWETIDAASSKPFGFVPFYPGPGLGGHCIPIDPFYLAWKAKRYEIPTRFIELAGEININMPNYVVSKIEEGLNRDGKAIGAASILLLGISYKKDIDDTRESPSLRIMSLLKEQGADVKYNDPYVPYISGFRRYPELKMTSIPLEDGSLERFDCVVIVTDHSCYNWKEIVGRSQLVIDTRNATRFITSGVEKIVKA